MTPKAVTVPHVLCVFYMFGWGGGLYLPVQTQEGSDCGWALLFPVHHHRITMSEEDTRNTTLWVITDMGIWAYQLNTQPHLISLLVGTLTWPPFTESQGLIVWGNNKLACNGQATCVIPAFALGELGYTPADPQNGWMDGVWIDTSNQPIVRYGQVIQSWNRIHSSLKIQRLWSE